MRIAAPAMVYQQETIPVRECAIMNPTGIFRDPLFRVKHRLNSSIETNHFTTTVVGSLTYKGGHSHCEGRDVHVNGECMVSLMVTKSLEVTVCEDFDSRDILVTDNGVSVAATLRQGQGIISDFGTLLLRQWPKPCRWKRVRDIIVI